MSTRLILRAGIGAVVLLLAIAPRPAHAQLPIAYPPMHDQSGLLADVGSDDLAPTRTFVPNTLQLFRDNPATPAIEGFRDPLGRALEIEGMITAVRFAVLDLRTDATSGMSPTMPEPLTFERNGTR